MRIWRAIVLKKKISKQQLIINHKLKKMNNKEFLFLYDAANCNPNGDPDQDNKPRMDRATKTNLVSSYRLKR